MGTSIFPVPVASSVNSFSLTIPAANTVYTAQVSLSKGVYTLTSVSGDQVNVEFYNGSTLVDVQQVTATGGTTYQLLTAADNLRLWTLSGTNVIFSYEFISSSLTISSPLSGTLDTVTTTSSYTGTSTSGYGWVMAVGGGGGAGGSAQTGRTGGGGSGGIGVKLVQLTGSVAVTVGNGGAGGTGGSRNAPVVQSTSGSPGGSTSIDGLTANGGAGSSFIQTAHTDGSGGARGSTTGSFNSYNFGAAGGNASQVGVSSSALWAWLKSGTTGGGGGGGSNTAGGGNGGIGTGGRGSDGNSSPVYGTGTNASGFGAGGGGSYNTGSGGSGSAGVIYVFKF